MNEFDILETIKNTLSDSSYIGDDCAWLKDLGIFVTQDNLVEDVHFSLSFMTPFELGVKSVSVNISDLCAALCTPKYITIGLSLPSSLPQNFVEDFYKGIDFACEKYGVKVVGGDVTGGDKLFVSISAIGKKENQIDVARSNAKVGDVVLLSGISGASACGLCSLLRDKTIRNVFVEAHLNPQIAFKEARILSELNPKRVAAMDTSDGLADALYKVGAASGVTLEIDIDKVPVLDDFYEKCDKPIERILFGGEDYALLMCVSQEVYERLDKQKFTAIGRVLQKTKNISAIVNIKDGKIFIDEKSIKEKSFNHFKNVGGQA